MSNTFFSKRPDNRLQSSQQRGTGWLQQVARGLGALLVRLGTQELDSSTRIVRGTTGHFLVHLGARLDAVALRSGR